MAEEVLLGNGTIGSSSTAIASGKMGASKVECTKSGLLKTLSLFAGTTHGDEEYWVGLFNCNQSTGEPEGSPLAQAKWPKKEKLATEGKFTVEISSGGVSVTKGTFYAVAVMAKSGNWTVIYTAAGTTATFKSSNTVTEITKPTSWESFSTGQFAVIGEGEPSSAKSNAGKVTMALKALGAGFRTIASSAAGKLGFDTSAEGHKSNSGVGPGTSTMALRAGGTGYREVFGAATGHLGFDSTGATGERTEALTQLIGNSTTEGTSGNVSVNSQKVEAFQFEAAETGEVERLAFHTGTAESGAGISSVHVAILADSGGKPGAVLGEASSALAVKTGVLYEVPGLSVFITKGTKYWLAFMPIGGIIKFKREGSPTALHAISATPTKASTIAGVETWTVDSLGPMLIFASGRMLPPREGYVTLGMRATSAGVRGGIGVGQAHIAFDTSAEGFAGGRGSGYAHFALRGIAAAGKELFGPGAVHLGLRTEATGSIIKQKLDQYYGPPEEEAAESTRWFKPVKERESARFGDMYPAVVAGAPLVIFVHGGGWVVNNKETVRTNAESVAKEGGCAVFNIEYRLASASVQAFAKEVEDVERAVRWAIEHAAEFNSSTSQVFLLGGSAGGHLVTMAAKGLNATSPVVKGVISLSGIYDFPTLVGEMEAETYKTEIGGAEGGKGQRDLIQHTQWALACTLAPGVKERTGIGPVCSTEHKAWMEQWSPRLQTIANHPAKYLFFCAEKDLIPRNQFTNMASHVENGTTRVTAEVISGIEEHAFEYWPKAKPIIFAWLKEQEGSGYATMGIGHATATGSGKIFGGGGSSTLGFRATAAGLRGNSGAGSSTLGLRVTSESHRGALEPRSPTQVILHDRVTRVAIRGATTRTSLGGPRTTAATIHGG